MEGKESRGPLACRGKGEKVMALDKLGFALLAAGVVLLLYGLLGGPAAQIGLIVLGICAGLIGGVLIAIKERSAP